MNERDFKELTFKIHTARNWGEAKKEITKLRSILKRENYKIREKICNSLIQEKIKKRTFAKVWLLITDLIENEIKQEEMCGE